MTTETLLLEIGVEELPSSFVDAALAALPKIVEQKLAELRLAHGAIRVLGTPRRLAVLVENLATAQRDLDEEVLGPPETAAFKDGKPTKAAEAFAAKIGVSVDALTVVDGDTLANKKPNQKPGRYVVGRRKESGRAARELLGHALAEICASIPFRKSMRWGDGDATFGRPVQWLVAIFGSAAIDMSFAGVRSGRQSRGHRFLSPGKFEIDAAEKYVETMRKAHVLVDRSERERTMMERVDAAAKATGGSFVPDPYLVDENASLVEEPHVVTGSFDRAFLELPREVIIAVARGHQKYFSIEDDKKNLLPNYIAVVNTANAPENIIKGNDRVMKARLSDAKFFFEEDKKGGFSRWNEKIATIVFHARLGSVKEKVTRLEKLAAIFVQLAFGGAKEHDGLEALAENAAALCKSDLASLMVGEFPELQGTMGFEYAKAAGKDERIAQAIRDHYKPVGADDDLPKGDVAAIVALADRIDTLTGCFAVGLAPTGSADPYALRRNCIAALRLLSEHSHFESLRWGDLIHASYTQFEWKKPADLDEADTVTKISEFATERLRGLITNKTSHAVADAVLAGSDNSLEQPAFALMKATSLQKVIGEPWIETARAVGKRLRGISKDAKPVNHAFAKDDAKNGRIANLVHTLDESTRELATTGVEVALEGFESVAKDLAAIFDETLINDPNDPLTQKRLELLSYGASCMLRIADFSRLS